MAESEINIGADPSQFTYSDDETPASKHEDAAFDYVEGASNITEESDKKNDDAPPSGSYPNGFAGLQSMHGLQSINGQFRQRVLNNDGENIPKFFFNEGTLKAKQKLEKKKKKKAEGWTKSNDMEGHVVIRDLEDILNFVGEDAEQSDAQPSQQKKKHRKKSTVTSKQRNSYSIQQSAVNGKSASLGVDGETSSDSEIDDANIVPITNGVMDPIAHRKGAANAIFGANEAIPVNARQHFTVIDNEVDTTASSVDGEFKEVHRKKKSNYRPSIIDKCKPVTAATNHYNRVPVRSLKPNGTISRQSDSSGKTAATVAASLARMSAAQTPDNVDLSLNAFPALESQTVDRSSFGDTRSSVHTESTSATDDERDSVASQPIISSVPSWAKIAAQPTSRKPITSDKHISANKTSTVDLIAPAAATAVQSQCSPTFNSELSPRSTEIPSFKDIPSSTDMNSCMDMHNSMDIHNSTDVHSSMDIRNSVDITSSTPHDDSTVQSDQSGNEPAMTRSAAGALAIEFGTVMSSADRQVLNILSQSYTEGQNMFKSSNQSSALTKSADTPAIFRVSKFSKPARKSKGVEFFDEYPGQHKSCPNINVSFGFDSECIPAQLDSDCISGATKQSYPGVTNSDAVRENSDTEAVTPILSKTAAEGTAVIDPNVLPQPVDILSLVLSADAKASPEEVTDTGDFNVQSTVNMLKTEWDRVMMSRRLHGSASVAYAHELPGSY